MHVLMHMWMCCSPVNNIVHVCDHNQSLCCAAPAMHATVEGTSLLKTIQTNRVHSCGGRDYKHHLNRSAGMYNSDALYIISI